MVVTVKQSTATAGSAFSYDRPRVTSVPPLNVPVTGGVVVYVYGDSFGSSDYGAVVWIGGTACATTTYFTSSFLQCTASAGVGAMLDVVVGVAGQEGSMVGVQSYDAPDVTGVAPASGSTVGGTVVTASGDSFGVFDSSVGLRVGGTS